MQSENCKVKNERILHLHRAWPVAKKCVNFAPPGLIGRVPQFMLGRRRRPSAGDLGTTLLVASNLWQATVEGTAMMSVFRMAGGATAAGGSIERWHWALRQWALCAWLLLAALGQRLPAATIGPGGDSMVDSNWTNSGTVPSLDVFRIPLLLPSGSYEVASFGFHNVTVAASDTTPGSVTPFLALLTDPGEELVGPSRSYQSLWAGPSTSLQNVPDINNFAAGENVAVVTYSPGSQRFTLTAETQVYAGIYTLGAGRVAYRPAIIETPLGRVDHDTSFTPVTAAGQPIAGFSNPHQNRFYAFEIEVIPSDAPPLVPGDFNADGNVDGADFVVWQTNFPALSGKTLATGDANGDGAVDGADFVIWQTNFPTIGGSAVAVPEPSGFVVGAWMAIVAALCCGVGRHRLHRD
jgi:hypothetical protein